MAAETSRNSTERCCRTCGKSIEHHSYEFWLVHCCHSCAAEPAPRRWGDVGTCRKWQYFPRWHMVKHPDRPDHIRNRQEVVA